MRYRSFDFETSNDAYGPMIKHILERGLKVPSRLGETREISSVLNIAYPRFMVPFPYGRRFNYFGMLMESLWILSDVDEVSLIDIWNGSLKEYSDDGSYLYGAYGPRLQAPSAQDYVDYSGKTRKNNLSVIISQLKDDPSNRQAVLPIINQNDVGKKTKDFTCNLLAMFKIRDGRLHMTVANRSNDIHWGLFAVNLPQFALLQNHIAYELGALLGYQSHVSDSLHLYMEQPEHNKIMERMGKYQWNHFDMYAAFSPDRKPFPVLPYKGIEDKVVRHIFTRLSNGQTVATSGYPLFLRVAVSMLETYAQFKQGEFDNRKEAIEFLGDSIRHYVSDLGDDPYWEFPADWVFGGYSTLVQFAQEHARADLASFASEEFVKLLKSYPDVYEYWYKNQDDVGRMFMSRV